MKQEFKVSLKVYEGRSSKAANGVFDTLLRESYLMSSKFITIDNGTCKIDDVHINSEHPMYVVTVDLIINVTEEFKPKYTGELRRGFWFGSILTTNENDACAVMAEIQSYLNKNDRISIKTLYAMFNVKLNPYCDVDNRGWKNGVKLIMDRATPNRYEVGFGADPVYFKKNEKDIYNDIDRQVSEITKILNEDGFITISMVQNITRCPQPNRRNSKDFDSTHGWVNGDLFRVVYDNNKVDILFNDIPRDLTDLIEAKRHFKAMDNDLIELGNRIQKSIDDALKAAEPIKFKKDPLLVETFLSLEEYNKLLHLTDVWNLWTGGTEYIPVYVDSVLDYFGSIGYMNVGVPYINFMSVSTKEAAIEHAKTLDEFIKVHGKMTLAEYYKCFNPDEIDHDWDDNHLCWTVNSKAIISYNPKCYEYTVCFNKLPVPLKAEPKLKMLNGRDTIIASDYESGKAAWDRIVRHVNRYGYITLNEVCKINGIDMGWFDGDGKGWILGDTTNFKGSGSEYLLSFVTPIRHLTDDLKKVSKENAVLYNLALKNDPIIDTKGLDGGNDSSRLISDIIKNRTERFKPGFIDLRSLGNSSKPTEIESRDYTTLYSNSSSICAKYCGDINDHIRLYGKITIAQYYLLCDRPDLITKDDYNYGWVRGAYVDDRNRAIGYGIRMNEHPIKLGGIKNGIKH